MTLQKLIDTLIEAKKNCELNPNEVQVLIRLTNDVIDRFTDDDKAEEIKEELKYGNYYPWRDEHIRINRFSGFGSNGQSKMFEELIIEGDQ
jgi:hypothetical protein|tara:strand:- start:1154 stop:1426 length:273 start_codon:yes stop_codon:yes gene_type:complete